MTVIAWDGKTLAADRQATCANMRTSTTKIKKLSTGEVIGGTGDLVALQALFRWYEEGAKPECWPSFQKSDDFSRFIVAKAPGVLEYYEWLPFPVPVVDPFTAFGSGRDFAMGALASGATAADAVLIASRFEVHCGLGVDAFEVGGVA